MPFKPVVAPKCPKCQRSVYAAEERVAAGHKFHVSCFVCGMCNKRLDSTTVAPHETELYCKQCHGRKYGPKGYGFGQGAGTLGMDSGEQFGNKQTQMSNVPQGNALNGPDTNTISNGTANHINGTANHVNGNANQVNGNTNSGGGAGGNKCLRCGKSVYHAEKAIGTSQPFHKSCFSCRDCKKKLDSSIMAMHENEAFCKGCHGKHFGPTGYGFGGGAGALSMHQ